MAMRVEDHFRLTGGALKRWFVAQLKDSAAVAVLGLVGPMIELSVEGLLGGDWMKLIYLLIMYAVIAAIDGFFLQPYIMKRTAKVPVWASIVTPIVMGIFLGVW